MKIKISYTENGLTEVQNQTIFMIFNGELKNCGMISE